MIDFITKLQFKNDAKLIAYAFLLATLTAAAVYFKIATPKEGLLTLGAALTLPGMFGRKDDSATDETKVTPKGPSALPLIPLAFVATFAMSNAACARVLAAADLFAEKAQCAVAHQNLSDAQIIAECALEPGDIDKVMAIVGNSRNQSSLEANHAAAIQQEKDRTAGLCH